MRDHWSQARATVLAYGLTLPDDADGQLAAIVGDTGAGALRAGKPAIDLVQAWRTSKQRGSLPDTVWLATLVAFQTAFKSRPPGMYEALHAQFMNIGRTEQEIAMKLGGMLFRQGRAADSHGDYTLATVLLTEAAAQLTTALHREDRLPDSARRGLHGQLGIASLLLSRYSKPENKQEFHQQAIRSLLTSEEHGDKTADHFTYLIQAYLAAHEHTGDTQHLTDGRGVWQRSPTTPPHRGLLSAAALLHERLARAADTDTDRQAATSALETAEGLLTEALNTDGGRSGITDGFLLAVRARVRHQLHEHAQDDRRKWLILSQQDMNDPDAAPHMGVHSGVKILMTAARAHSRAGEHEQALELLQTATQRLSNAGEETRETVADELRSAQLDSELFLAVQQADDETVRRLATEALAVPKEIEAPAAALSLAARYLLTQSTDEDTLEIARRVVARISSDLQGSTMPDSARRHVTGHAARLAWIYARQTGQVARLQAAATLFRQALETGVDLASAVLLGDAGSCALALAKSSTDAPTEPLLRDATHWLSAALRRAQRVPHTLPQNFDAAMLHSRAGEAFARLHAETGNDADLNAAIEHLQAALDLGHPFADLRGHLADALYRRGRRNGNSDDLRAAVAYKNEDWDSGARTRENRSVAAAAATILYDMGGDDSYLTDAVRFAAQAVTVDPRWPWPVMQLAELARTIPPHGRGDGQSQSVTTTLPPPLDGLFAARDHAGLWNYAANLAATTDEFNPAPLGGQTSRKRMVYVLADQHRLLEQTLVLKRLDVAQAHHEFDTTSAFTLYLRRTGAPRTWRVPDPIAVMPDPSDPSLAIYIMRRARGLTLGQLADLGESVTPHVEAAVHFLASFIAFASEHKPKGRERVSSSRIRRLCDKLSSDCSRLGLPKGITSAASAGLHRRLVTDGVAVAKRDAHAGNWLITDGGDIVAIDLESSTELPMLWEVAQLIDDHPFMPATVEGWTQRIRFAHEHLNDLRAAGLAIFAPENIPETLAWYLFAHAVSQLNRLRPRGYDPDVSLTGAQAKQRRRDHTGALLELLATTTLDPSLRETARSAAAYRGDT
jgi:tetratricopeptide (TPR) repeat protein